MRRFMAVFLSALLIFNLCAGPVSAAYSIEDDYAVAQMSVAPAAVGAGAIAISSAGAGTFLAGAASTTPLAVIALCCVIGYGVVFHDIPQMINDAQVILDYLSEEVLAELEAIAANLELGSSIDLSDQAISELNDAMADYYYTGGTFAGGLTFPENLLIDYNYSRDSLIGAGQPSAVYQYPVTATRTEMGDSGIYIRYVESPYDGYGYGLELFNAVTGVALTIMSGQLADGIEDYVSGAATALTASMPFVAGSYTTKAGLTYHDMGIWLLSTMADGTYDTNRAGDRITHQDVYMLTGTGTELDGMPFDSSPTVYDGETLSYIGLGLLAGGIYQTLAKAFEMVLSYPKTRSIADDGVKPLALDTPIFVPNTWEKPEIIDRSTVRPDTATEDVPTTDTDTKGLWDTLFGRLSDLLTGIQTGFKSVVDAIGNIVGGIVSGISEVLSNLFVPDTSEIEEVLDVYTAKFGWVMTLYYFMEDIIERLTWDKPPKIAIDLSAAESKYNWGTGAYVLDMSWYARYKDSVDTIISGIVWVFFLWRLFRRLPDILSGVGMTIEDATMSRGHVWSSRAERAERTKKGG